jgi:hypothetical protein
VEGYPSAMPRSSLHDEALGKRYGRAASGNASSGSVS